MTRAAPTLGLTLAGVVLVQYIAHTGPEPFNLTRALWQGVGGQYLMSGLLNKPILSLTQEISAIFQEVRDTFDQAEYLAIRQQATQRRLLKDIEKIKDELIARISDKVFNETKGYATALQCLANLPFVAQKPIEKTQFHDRLRTQIDQLIALFKPKL